MKDRLKKLRKALDLTQTEFAERIGSAQNTITGYESGRRSPSRPVIASICKEFNVSEEWLLYGTGEMFAPDAGDELEALAKKYGYSGAVAALVEKLVNLPPDRQEVVTDFLIEFASGIQSMKDAGIDPKGKAFPQGEPAEMSIDEKVEAYRRALEEEQAAGGKGESSAASSRLA